MERVALDLGIIQIYWYSIFIFLGAIFACTVIYKESERKKIDKEFILDLVLSTIIVGVLGARIYYIVFNLDHYRNNMFEMLEIWNGGLAIHGGILFGFINVLIKCLKNGIPVLKMLDIIVVGLILGQAIGRWGNFFNSEAYGAVTTYANLKAHHIPEFVIKGMYILGEYHQPTFLYESIFDFIGFVILYFIRKWKYIKVGQITGIYLMWYSFFRSIIEGSRTDSLMLGNTKVAILVSFILFIVGLLLVVYYRFIKKDAKLDHLYNEESKEGEFINNSLNPEEVRPLFIK